jgi:hypothetical protein
MQDAGEGLALSTALGGKSAATKSIASYGGVLHECQQQYATHKYLVTILSAFDSPD